MTWTAPRTWVTAETVTAAIMNAHVRDNLLETSAATVTVAGDIPYADAANSMGSKVAIGATSGMLVSDGSSPVWRIPAGDEDTGNETSTTTSYLTLNNGSWGFASEIEVSVVTGVTALIFWKANLANDTGGALTFLSYSISGATTSAASDTRSVIYESSSADDTATLTGVDLRVVTAGTNVFTLEGRVSAGTGKIERPEIVVLPL